MRFVEFYKSFVTTLLSRDYSTLIKRSLHSYQEITALLSRDLSTPIKRLQHSYQEISAFLSRDYSTLISTLIKRSQHSYQEISALLSRDYSKHNKMLEYLNFFLLCTLFALIFYLYIRTKRYINILKMAEDSLIFSGYDAPQSDAKRQKLLECVLTKTASCIWVRSTPKIK